MVIGSQILPTKHLVELVVSISDYMMLKSIFSNAKVFNFYCVGKQVIGDTVVLSVRAMRINEFIELLNRHNVKWSEKE